MCMFSAIVIDSGPAGAGIQEGSNDEAQIKRWACGLLARDCHGSCVATHEEQLSIGFIFEYACVVARYRHIIY